MGNEDNGVTPTSHGLSAAASQRREERELFVFPVPLRLFVAKLQLPQDMSHAEACKIAQVVLSFVDEPRGLSASEAPISAEAVNNTIAESGDNRRG